MSITLTSSVPLMLQMSGAPGVSVADVNPAQLMFNNTDPDPLSTGLYFLKGGSIGSQNWVKICTVQQLTSNLTRTPSYPVRSLNTAFQPSVTKDTMVSYSVDIACTLSLSGGQTGTVFLEICPNSA